MDLAAVGSVLSVLIEYIVQPRIQTTNSKQEAARSSVGWTQLTGILLAVCVTMTRLMGNRSIVDLKIYT